MAYRKFSEKRNPKSNVVSLHGLPIPGNSPPHAELIERMEMLLQMAKDGKLRGFAYAVVHDTECVSTGWCGDASLALELYGVSHLLYRMHRETE